MMDNAKTPVIFQNIQSWFEKKGYTSTQLDEIARFTEALFNLYPIDELEEFDTTDVAGMVKSLYEFSQQAPPGEPKLKIFTPRRETHGWNSPYTQIFILLPDMAFIVDSVILALEKVQYAVQNVNSSLFHVVRNPQGQLLNRFADRDDQQSNSEVLIYFQIGKVSETAEIRSLEKQIHDLLEEVEAVNLDFQPILAKLDEIIAEVELNHSQLKEDVLAENLQFLNWVKNNHFVFLGYSSYRLQAEEEPVLHHVKEGELGVFRLHRKDIAPQPLSSLSSGFREFYDSDQLLTLTQSSVRSRVHRDAYREYIVIKRFDEQGQLIGEHRLVGLYTSQVYAQSPFGIPLIRQKLNNIYRESGLRPGSHDGKSLREIIENYPREELLYGTQQQLFDTLIAIWQIKQRRVVRLFVRPDQFGKFVSCVVYVPRDLYNTTSRLKTQQLLIETFAASECHFKTYFGESLLVRVHFLLRTENAEPPRVDIKQLERQVSLLTRNWNHDLEAALADKLGNGSTREILRVYQNAFPASYCSDFSVETALADIELMAQLENQRQIRMTFEVDQNSNGQINFRVFHLNERLELSAVVPMLENLGFRVLGEHPYEIRRKDAAPVWLHKFFLCFNHEVELDLSQAKGEFERAFEAIWQQQVENDSFNQLVVAAGLDWQLVNVLRLYSRYLKQLGTTLGQDFIADTLVSYPQIAKQLVTLFALRFDPEQTRDNSVEEMQQQRILTALEEVSNLNQDQVLRTLLEMIGATLRTSFYMSDEQGTRKPYVAIKLAPEQLGIAPEPRPAFEIFVYSPRFEGVHLRSGKVARGGIRWSDRQEDYRTEVLGLVKAQQVKNAVIVPTGAKGGFVAKNRALMVDRKQWLAEGVACYQLFIGALLELTDNVVEGKVEPAENLVRQDDDDSYLVVAADKGTASFSDIANQVSMAHRHWLGDAFASGGSNGYDHKKMGITARGAWVAVQRHFRELGMDIQQQPFTAVGIGDMSGDVFGNGMLCSNQTRLVAAFNHLHIFLDPNPDPQSSFAERQRLFENVMGWAEYNRELISTGGGVFERSAKSINLSVEVQKLLQVGQESLTPAQLISAILRAPVDLLWNGGVGTYVKSRSESHFEVGDRANDELRVNGNELRCRVVGEGGNLGMTQLGRIEYCQAGGACNTDFIDNAGGVDCSDIEVNIKIVLNSLLEQGEITLDQRNRFLESMTEAVAELVLSHNYSQTQCISLAQFQARTDTSSFQQCMQDWEAQGNLNRALEKLPSDEDLADRQKSGLVLTRPELSVLVSYAKNLAKQALASSDVMQEPYLESSLAEALPEQMSETYGQAVQKHPLRREIIANRIANEMIDRMGISFIYRQQKSTGANIGEVARAYIIARDVFDIDGVWEEIEHLDHQLSHDRHYSLFLILMRLGRRSTRWLIRNRRLCTHVTREVTALQQLINEYLNNADALGALISPEQMAKSKQEFSNIGLSNQSVELLSNVNSLFFALGMADICLTTGLEISVVARVYRMMADVLSINWVAEQIVGLDVGNRWEDFARESHMDELEKLARTLAHALLQELDITEDLDIRFDIWKNSEELLIQRWQSMVADLRSATHKDFAMYSVALSEFEDLVNATTQADRSTLVCPI